MTDWAEISRRIFYQSVTNDDPESFSRLKSFLAELDATFEGNGNRLFYMALPPTMYKSVAHALHQADMAAEDPEKENWVRLVVEKSFGRDLESAIDLDKALHEGFSEH